MWQKFHLLCKQILNHPILNKYHNTNYLNLFTKVVPINLTPQPPIKIDLSSKYVQKFEALHKLRTKQYEQLIHKINNLTEHSLLDFLKWLVKEQQKIHPLLLIDSFQKFFILVSNGQISHTVLKYQNYRIICKKHPNIKIKSNIVQLEFAIKKQNQQVLASQKPSQNKEIDKKKNIKAEQIEQFFKNVQDNFDANQLLFKQVSNSEKVYYIWYFYLLFDKVYSIFKNIQTLKQSRFLQLLQTLQSSEIYLKDQIKNWYELNQYFASNLPPQQSQPALKQQFRNNILNNIRKIFHYRIRQFTSLLIMIKTLKNQWVRNNQLTHYMQLIRAQANSLESSYSQVYAITAYIFPVNLAFYDIFWQLYLQEYFVIISVSELKDKNDNEKEELTTKSISVISENTIKKLLNYFERAVQKEQRQEEIKKIAYNTLKIRLHSVRRITNDQERWTKMLLKHARELMNKITDKSKEKEWNIWFGKAVEQCFKGKENTQHNKDSSSDD